MMQRSLPDKVSQQQRAGFTLIELLIVISIMMLLLAMTVYGVNFSRDSERVRGSASQLQSFLAGARDRAIYEKKPVGVRLFLDSFGNETTVSSMAFVEAADSWSDGVIQLQRWDLNNDGLTDPASGTLDINGDGVLGDDPTRVWVVAGIGTGWWELKRRGLLEDDLRIRIPKGSQGNWYPISTSLIDITVAPSQTQKLILRIPYADPGDTNVESAQAFDAGGPNDYELELPASLRPEAPRLLSDQVVIDLDGSRIPSSWEPVLTLAATTEYPRSMDVLFSPRGNVIGDAASGGLIHFYVCNGNDSVTVKELLGPPVVGVPFIPADVLTLVETNDFPISDRRIVSLFTQTGAVTVSSVNPIDSGGDGIADDPFLFAEVGSEAN
jgi:prepilin-type N-terminal cleavage/methylation domain-containing protein